MFKQDATYYAEQIRFKNTSVKSMVELALTTIEKLNPTLNAVTSVQTQTALTQAEEYDCYLSTLKSQQLSQLPPFYGVPILLKDLGQNQKGQPSRSGSKLFRNHLADTTDNFVKRIESAGFIIVGRTNVPEFGFKNISDSQACGAVKSPLDLARNPGGSSGGAASALKSGMVPIVTASDGGGSIRIPASFNGLIGLKTSRGRILVGPNGYRGWQGASVNFALTKSVRDSWRLLKWMQTEQQEAPFTLSKIKEEQLTVPFRPLRIAFTTQSPIGGPVSSEAISAVRATVEQLTNLGHIMIETAPKVDGVKAMKDYYLMNSVETAVMMKSIEQSRHKPLMFEDMEPLSWGLYQAGLKVDGVSYSESLAGWDRLAASTDAFFTSEGIDLLLMPTTNGTAPLQDQFEFSPNQVESLRHMAEETHEEQQKIIWDLFEDSLHWTPFTQQQNLTGQPAISLPVCETTSGLPLGVQFSSRKGHEYVILQIALQLEQEGHLLAIT